MEYKGFGIVDNGAEYRIYKDGKFQAKFTTDIECYEWIDEQTKN